MRLAFVIGRGEEPVDQDVVGMVMADVLKSVSILRIIEALVFDFPPTFRHSENGK